MEKHGTFRNVKFTIRPTNIRGWYVVNATYKGKKIRVKTSDSEIYDYVDYDSDRVMYDHARRSCYTLISMEYKHRKEWERLK